MDRHKVILIIRDGWGYRPDGKENAICETPTPVMDRLLHEYPHTLVETCGEAVGLPDGYQGNSEVGHMTIGSGRIIFQSLARINKAIREGEFFRLSPFLEAIENCRRNKTSLHIIGLIQVEGVHSHLDHLFALLDLCKQQNFHDIYVHAITDGRDSPVTDSIKNLGALQKKLDEIGFGRIATISGRFYAMDRDKRWERTRQAYGTIVLGKGEEYTDALAQIKACHAAKEMDEFIVPRRIKGYAGIRQHDSVIFFNFRTDRTRQLTQAIIEAKFEGWERKPLDVTFVAMTQFYSGMNAKVAFEDQSLKNLLGEVVAQAKLRQLRISETEKYAHVTFFLNGQVEQAYDGEERTLIPSPKVQTYDLKPEMSVYEITEKLLDAIRDGKHDLIVTNLVNCDMVGHTGIPEAIRKAVACVDECTGRIIDEGARCGYTVLILADHGNAEDQTAEWRTSHTMNPVPLIIVSADSRLRHCHLKEGKGLRDVAPTVLQLLGIPKPAEMTGESIIE
jgi:2,3-bisphosphoglycerate-independent phosphoglycerate mutase